MDKETTKPTWKKPLRGPANLLAWLVILASSNVVMFFLLYLALGKNFSIPVTVTISIGLSLVIVFAVCFIRWLCHLRNLKRFLFVLVCLATLIALAYAEEDWRDKHALDTFKRDWEAKGEKFTLKEFLPPPVPDDQNFALTPIIASTYEATFDKSGHRMTPRLTNVVNRLEMPIEGSNGKDNPTNGYWAKGTRTDLAGWQQYYRALAAKTNLFPTSPQPGTPAADVLLALSKYDSTIEELRVASQLPYSRIPLEYDLDDPFAILLPHLSPLKGSSRLLQLRSCAELQNGESEKALADLKLLFYLDNSIRTEPFLISHLVRIAIMDIALQPLYEGLADHHWSESQLVALDTELAAFDFLADYQYAMRGERICGMTAVEYVRRTRNFYALDYSEKTDHEPLPFQNLVANLTPSAFFYQNELTMARLNLLWFLPMVDLEHRTASPATVRQNISGITGSLKGFLPYNILARMVVPALTNSVERFAWAQSAIDKARVGIALERFRLARGDYPESLDALAPQFIDIIPHDIINGQPLKYLRTDDAQFALYSVGWNEKDDGGERGRTKNDSIDRKTGDWVWRYPAK